MNDLILHHYEASPFSEKARLALGYKGLAWKSVRIPAVMPKPDVIALTGGYRKTPLLQIGNHVYCDTSLIVRVLDARQPTPPLVTGALSEIIAQWADAFLFDTAVAIAFRPTRFDALMLMMQPEELAAFRDDRKSMAQDARRLPPPYGTARAQLPVYAARLEGMLRDQAYLTGPTPTVADFSAYHPCWFVELTSPELLEPFASLRAWMARIASIGHGRPDTISSSDAIEICRSAKPPSEPLPEHTATELSRGQAVRVRATDLGRETSEGTIVFARDNEVAIARQDPRAGHVVVHFPRVGYDVIPT